MYPRSSQTLKIGIYLLIDKSTKIGKSDLIDIDCIDQSVEIDDTLVSFIDLSRFYRFHLFLSEDTFGKVVLFFRTKYSKRKFGFHFFKAIVDTSFRKCFDVFVH